MQITLNFEESETPDISEGTYKYFFVRVKSEHDGRVRTYGAYYLNAYPLNYEWGCSKCEDIGEDNCPAVNGDGCPTTGWFSEDCNESDDCFYNPVYGKVIGFAEQPQPETT